MAKRIYKNKKGFELSINFIVMVILSLVMLGVGFFFAKNIFFHTTEIGEQLDYQTKQQLESKLRDPSALVAIGVNKKLIKRNNQETFGVGVANRDKEEGYFFLEVECKIAQIKDENGDETKDATSCPGDTEKFCCNEWIQSKISGNKHEIDIGVLEPNEFEVATVFFNIHKKAEPGEYVYNVQVRRKKVGNSGTGIGQPTNYDSVKKIYVTIP